MKTWSWPVATRNESSHRGVLGKRYVLLVLRSHGLELYGFAGNILTHSFTCWLVCLVGLDWYKGQTKSVKCSTSFRVLRLMWCSSGTARPHVVLVFFYQGLVGEGPDSGCGRLEYGA